MRTWSRRPTMPVGALLHLTLIQLLRTKVVLLTVLVLLLPVGFAAFWSLPKPMPGDSLMTVWLLLWGRIYFAYLQFLVPFVALLYGATLVSAETEAQTLSYLVTRPTPRWLTLLMKYVTAAIICIVGIWLSMTLSCLLLAQHFGLDRVLSHQVVWIKFAGIAAAGVLVYLSLFLFMSLLVRRPVVLGLIFIVLWEWFIGMMPGMIRFMTLIHYLRSLAMTVVARLPAEEGFMLPNTITIHAARPAAVFVVLPTIWVALMAFCLWRFTCSEFHTNPDRK